MEYCEHGELTEYIKPTEGVCWPMVKDGGEQNLPLCHVWIEQICTALVHLRDLSVMHRDIKPENVLIASNSRGTRVPKLSDLGLALEVQDQTRRTYGVAGTPSYMAPEISAGLPYFCEVDVWSFSLVVYEMTTGGDVKDEHVASIKKRFRDGVATRPTRGRSGRGVEKRLESRVPEMGAQHGNKIKQLLRFIMIASPAERPAPRSILEHMEVLGLCGVDYASSSALSTEQEGYHRQEVTSLKGELDRLRITQAEDSAKFAAMERKKSGFDNELAKREEMITNLRQQLLDKNGVSTTNLTDADAALEPGIIQQARTLVSSPASALSVGQPGGFSLSDTMLMFSERESAVRREAAVERDLAVAVAVSAARSEAESNARREVAAHREAEGLAKRESALEKDAAVSAAVAAARREAESVVALARSDAAAAVRREVAAEMEAAVASARAAARKECEAAMRWEIEASVSVARSEAAAAAQKDAARQIEAIREAARAERDSAVAAMKKERELVREKLAAAREAREAALSLAHDKETELAVALAVKHAETTAALAQRDAERLRAEKTAALEQLVLGRRAAGGAVIVSGGGASLDNETAAVHITAPAEPPRRPTSDDGAEPRQQTTAPTPRRLEAAVDDGDVDGSRAAPPDRAHSTAWETPVRVPADKLLFVPSSAGAARAAVGSSRPPPPLIVHSTGGRAGRNKPKAPPHSFSEEDQKQKPLSAPAAGGRARTSKTRRVVPS